MITYIVSSIGFFIALMLQYGIFSRWTLLSGSADIVLLFIVALCLHSNVKRLWVQVLIFGAIVGAISAIPFYFIMAFYFAIFLAAQLIRKRIMQTPLLSMYLLTFIATLAWHALNIAYLFIKRIPFDLSTALFEIMLPGLLLNILVSIVIHAIVQEGNRMITPKGAEV
jgi:hypothetical protein